VTDEAWRAAMRGVRFADHHERSLAEHLAEFLEEFEILSNRIGCPDHLLAERPRGTRRYLGDQLRQANAGRTVPVDYRARSVRVEMP
jgi:hypothetical protein